MSEHLKKKIDISYNDVILDAEEYLPEEELSRRRSIGEHIVKLVPRDALENLQIFQPAIGCVNRCGFCSQLAGPVARELDKETLQTIVGGIKGAMSYFDINRLGDERRHKPGVIFPYLDNDIGSYPHLQEFIDGMASLNTKTRLSTVGWSRHNQQLQTMHEVIAQTHQDHVDGIRFSLTPYTYGWRTNHDEYILDLANAIETYKPYLDAKGTGRRTGCVELRFKPDVSLGDLEHHRIGRYNLVRCGEYTLITRGDLDETTTIQRMGEKGPELSSEGAEAVNVIGDSTHLNEEEEIDALFNNLAQTKGYQVIDDRVLAMKGEGRIFSNIDGDYYCFNPFKDSDGFNAIHYYPRTESRAQSGILDATRPFLNSLITYKRSMGYQHYNDLPSATTNDVGNVLNAIKTHSDIVARFSPRRAQYIRDQVLPIINDATEIIERANLTPDYFFKYRFLVDTGVIVNQGKAVSEFQGLASHADIPLTPNEEKGYGSTSQSSVRGIGWRIAPVETLTSNEGLKTYGLKSLPLIDRREGLEMKQRGIIVQLGFFALNPEAYTSKNTDGTDLPAYYIPLPSTTNKPLRKITPASGQTNNLLPGSRRKE